MDIFSLLGIAGMILILLAFIMGQTKRWKDDDLIYDLTNFAGSLLLVIYAIAGNAWPFIILNSIWGLYSLHDVIADLQNHKNRKHHILKSKKAT